MAKAKKADAKKAPAKPKAEAKTKEAPAAQAEPKSTPAKPQKRQTAVGDTVFYQLGEIERTVNGRRVFPAAVIRLLPGDRVDLRVYYGTGRGWGEHFNVPAGKGPGQWTAESD